MWGADETMSSSKISLFRWPAAGFLPADREQWNNEGLSDLAGPRNAIRCWEVLRIAAEASAPFHPTSPVLV